MKGYNDCITIFIGCTWLYEEQNSADLSADIIVLQVGPLNKFQCGKCQKIYNLKKTLKRHLIYECGQEPRFPCPYCNVRSKHKSNLLNHIRAIHRVSANEALKFIMT